MTTTITTIAEMQARINDLEQQVAEWKQAKLEWERYAEGLQERIIRHEAAYRELDNRHGRAGVIAHQMLAEIEELQEQLRAK